MRLLPDKEKEILQSVADACIRAALGHNYVFSRIGKFITKAQKAYFTSGPSHPRADGLEKSDADSLLEFFEGTNSNFMRKCGIRRSSLKSTLMFHQLPRYQRRLW
jgi:hypothetical protein